jgi:Predicted hydrolases or acyltransferases (alpha/beta hydrolase superfamily)
MEEFVANGKKLTYQIVGDSGEYLLFLNGLMMTDKSWYPLLPTLKQHYRIVLLNMHDMGSSEMMTQQYTIETQVDAVNALVEHLGLSQINVIGTSYGGATALLFAIKYPNKVKRMMTFNAMVYADTFITEVGRLWQRGAASYDVDIYYDTFVPFIYAPWYFEKYSESIYSRKNMLRHLKKEYFDSIIRLSKSAEGFDVRDRLGEITAPTFIIGCDEDCITPIKHQKFVSDNIPNSKYVIIPGGGHGIFYEDSELIVSMIMGWFRDIEVLPVFEEGERK